MLLRRVPLRLLAALTLPILAAAAAPSFAAQRRLAVRRGLAHLLRSVQGADAVAELRTDAVAIFLQLGETAADPRLREPALAAARRSALRLQETCCAPGGLASSESVQDALWLLTEAPGLELPTDLLRAALRERLDVDPEAAYFETPDPHLDELDEAALFRLLLASYTVERARLAEPSLPEPRLHLAELLAFVRNRRFVGFAEEDPNQPLAFDHFFLATHFVYVLSDYGRLRLEPAALGSLLPWLRAQMAHFLAQRYVDGVAEGVEILRILGIGDEDADLARGTRFLLKAQRRDGSWGNPRAATLYDRVHPTWVAAHALKERHFWMDLSWQRYVEGLLREPRRGAARNGTD